LEHDARLRPGTELVFLQDFLEDAQGEILVAVLLHIHRHEGAYLFGSAEQGAQSFFDAGGAPLRINRIEL